ncbi:hypothetical protein PI125_g25076 [Phytophthora idaei]|nr:hypothetical protein PI125_g25076 [Phytophthora idaei]KAG3124865.1 hypothetical protein PI126_g23047 [Phytophthora idaei]
MPPSLPSLECDPAANRQALACVRVVCRHGPDALRLPHVKLASYAMEPVDSSMRNPHFQQSQFSQGVTTAVHTGNLELIELLSTHFTGCSVPTKALQVAALLGNHDVFQWFVTHREDTEWDDSVVHHAVEGDHFELAQWLFERMASTRVRKIKRWAASAARKGNLDMIKWIWSLSEDIKLQQAMQDAVDFGHLEVTYDATAADAAVRNGHFAIARFLHEYREWNECDIIRALRECPYSNRRWEFAEWMYWHHRDELESMVEDIFADL